MTQENLHINSRLLLFFELLRVCLGYSKFDGIVGGGAHLELSLEALALDGDLAEGLPEEVLRSVSATVATIACDGQNKFLVFFFICEDVTEAIRQLQEVAVLDDSRLEKAGLHIYLLENQS